MIKVTKDYNNIPDSLKNEKFKKHLENFKLGKVQPSADYYGAEDVKEQLKLIYNNKCCYCETITNKPHTEHYRPQSVYLYLVYEWSNLLPACHSCNSSKSNKFPVLKQSIKEHLKTENSYPEVYAKKLNELEMPLILNPEIDDPAKHFTFSVSTGEIISETNEGVETINICQLNNEDLIYHRKKVINSIVERINNLVLEGFDKGDVKNYVSAILVKKIFPKIQMSTTPQNEYSQFKTFIFNNFTHFVDENFENKVLKSLLIKTFEEFCNS